MSNIAIIGIGDYGTTFINYMKENKLSAKMISLDNDAFTLARSEADEKVYVITELKEKFNVLKELTQDQEIVYISSGIGSETGGEYTKDVVLYFKRLGKKVVALVNKPFSFEGEEKMNRADEIEKSITEIADIVVSADNNHMKRLLLEETEVVPLDVEFKNIDSFFKKIIDETRNGSFQFPSSLLKETKPYYNFITKEALRK